MECQCFLPTQWLRSASSAYLDYVIHAPLHTSFEQNFFLHQLKPRLVFSSTCIPQANPVETKLRTVAVYRRSWRWQYHPQGHQGLGCIMKIILAHLRQLSTVMALAQGWRILTQMRKATGLQTVGENEQCEVFQMAYVCTASSFSSARIAEGFFYVPRSKTFPYYYQTLMSW